MARTCGAVDDSRLRRRWNSRPGTVVANAGMPSPPLETGAWKKIVGTSFSKRSHPRTAARVCTSRALNLPSVTLPKTSERYRRGRKKQRTILSCCWSYRGAMLSRLRKMVISEPTFLGPVGNRPPGTAIRRRCPAGEAMCHPAAGTGGVVMILISFSWPEGTRDRSEHFFPWNRSPISQALSSTTRKEVWRPHLVAANRRTSSAYTMLLIRCSPCWYPTSAGIALMTTSTTRQKSTDDSESPAWRLCRYQGARTWHRAFRISCCCGRKHAPRQWGREVSSGQPRRWWSRHGWHCRRPSRSPRRQRASLDDGI